MISSGGVMGSGQSRQLYNFQQWRFDDGYFCKCWWWHDDNENDDKDDDGDDDVDDDVTIALSEKLSMQVLPLATMPAAEELGAAAQSVTSLPG